MTGHAVHAAYPLETSSNPRVPDIQLTSGQANSTQPDSRVPSREPSWSGGCPSQWGLSTDCQSSPGGRSCFRSEATMIQT